MTMLVLMSLVGAILFAKLFPETPTGRRLHQVFVEAPARWLSGRHAKRLLWSAVLVAVLCLALAHNIPPVALPLDALASLEMSTFLEIAAALAALSASAILPRCRAIWSACRLGLAQARRFIAFDGLSRLRAGSERRRPARRAATRSSPTEDGEPERQWAFAVA